MRFEALSGSGAVLGSIDDYSIGGGALSLGCRFRYNLSTGNNIRYPGPLRKKRGGLLGVM